MPRTNGKSKENIMIDHLVQTTHFGKDEVGRLFDLFKCLTKDTKGKLDRNRFRTFLYEVFDMTDDLRLDMIIRFFNKTGGDLIGKDDFVRGLSVYLRGTFEEQAKFCFDAYSITKQGFITRNDFIPLVNKGILKPSTEEDPEDFMRDLIDMVIKKLDLDGDSKISYPEFVVAARKTPELLQALGILLPTKRHLDAFNEEYLKPKNKRTHGNY